MPLGISSILEWSRMAMRIPCGTLDSFEDTGFFKFPEKKSTFFHGNTQKPADGFNGGRAVMLVFQNPNCRNQQVRFLIKIQLFHRIFQSSEITSYFFE